MPHQHFDLQSVVLHVCILYTLKNKIQTLIVSGTVALVEIIIPRLLFYFESEGSKKYDLKKKFHANCHVQVSLDALLFRSDVKESDETSEFGRRIMTK
jgi:hypothetical protein